jgi:hypothetical protein
MTETNEQSKAAARAFIYTLADPRTGEIRYVGKTLCIEYRLKKHLHEKTTTHKANWIRSLKSLGLAPKIEILEETTESDWGQCEIFWMETLRFFGFKLTNMAEGGSGGAKPMSEVTKAKMRALRLGKKASPETRKKISEVQKGKTISLESRAKMSAAKRGIKLNANQLAALKKAATGRVVSAETRQKLSIARKGKKFPEHSARMTGRTLSASARLKLSIAHKGRIITPEHRAKISATLMGHPVSDESKQKMRAAKEAKKEQYALET